MTPKDHQPLSPKLQDRVRVLQHDLVKVRENVAIGRVRPEHYTDLERVLAARLELLEAEVHARLLDEARRVNARFRLDSDHSMPGMSSPRSRATRFASG